MVDSFRFVSSFSRDEKKRSEPPLGPGFFGTPRADTRVLRLSMAMSGLEGELDGDDRDVMAVARARMVEDQLLSRRIRDPRVVEVMGRMERHRFVPGAAPRVAYGDFPVAIGRGQTLSQPYVVAFMTQALSLQGNDEVLEIGTGSGYQTAVLAELARKVFTVEFLPALSLSAQKRIIELGYENVRFRIGDGRLGWPEEAPFDAILVTAAPVSVPPLLLEQLSPGGRLVIPVGPSNLQELELHERDDSARSGFRVERLGPVRFVPLV